MFRRVLSRLVKKLHETSEHHSTLFSFSDVDHGEVLVEYLHDPSVGGSIAIKTSNTVYPIVGYNKIEKYHNTPDPEIYLDLDNLERFEGFFKTHSAQFSTFLDNINA